MKLNVKYIGIRLFIAFIWILFVDGGKKYVPEYYLFYESENVKIYHSVNLDITELTKEQEKAIKHLQIKEYQNWEPYYKRKPKTKPLYQKNY